MEIGAEQAPKVVTPAKPSFGRRILSLFGLNHEEAKPVAPIQSETPLVPNNDSLEAAKKELGNLMEMRTKGGADFNTPATRALDDKREQELNAIIATHTTTPPPAPTTPETQPGTITEFPRPEPQQPATVEHPAEEKIAA